jgi:dipeptidyl aminopeptidase/acylaminoacyl peptidase
MPVGGGAEKILYRSTDPYYDEPTALLSDSTALIRRESQTMSPNYFSAPLAGGEPVQLTYFPGRYDNIKMPTRQFLKYKRADGVDLTAIPWLPGYDKSQGPLPTLMEGTGGVQDADSASQERISRMLSGLAGVHLYLVQAVCDSSTTRPS